jgi:hypothetical protein
MNKITGCSAQTRGRLAWVCLLTLSVTALAAAPQVLLQEKRSPFPEKFSSSFELPAVPAGQQVRLSLDMRIDDSGFGGSNGSLALNVNGDHAIGAPNLLNKRPFFVTADGGDAFWTNGGSEGTVWRAIYAPDFSDRVRTERTAYGMPEDDAYHFVFDITQFVTPGKNTLSFETQGVAGKILVLRHVQVEVGAPLPTPEAALPKPAPAGEVPVYVAAAPQSVPMEVQLSPKGALRLKVAGKSFGILSRTSDPDGKWATAGASDWKTLAAGETGSAQWQGAGYKVSRAVSVQEDRICVADTITNTSDKLIGVIYENRAALADRPAATFLAGRRTLKEVEETHEPRHPTAIATWPGLALGLVAEDDNLRAHIRIFAEAGTIGLADPMLGIPPNGSHTLEWSIYPAPGGDYWSVVNAIRRHWGANYRIEGVMFAWSYTGLKMTDDLKAQRDCLERRGATWLISSQTSYEEYGHMAEGPAIRLAKVWYEAWIHAVEMAHQSGPEYRALLYVHPQICNEPNCQKLYADSIYKDARGKPTTYYGAQYPMFLVTTENAYGKALMKTVEQILTETQCDGFYVDGWSYDPYEWAAEPPWDNCSVNIDPDKHSVTGRITSTVLLQQPWKVNFVKYLREHGKMMLGNGGNMTRTLQQLRMPVFVEAWSTAAVVNLQLDTPYGLGAWDDSGNDRARLRMASRMLNNGGLLVPWSWPDKPEGLHYIKLMYPMTPVELHAGVVLAEEKIVTNRSGRFGWPDNSPAQVYVFNGDGRMVENPAVKEIRDGDELLTEVRMPSDHLAVLVKKHDEKKAP